MGSGRNKGPGDLTYLGEEAVEGRRGLGLHVYQDGLNDSYNWTIIHVKQEVSSLSWESLHRQGRAMDLRQFFICIF